MKIILENANHKVNNINDEPSFNGPVSNNINYHFKNPPQELLGAYFVKRNNPFKETYPYSNNQYTLEDLLKKEESISEAFLFYKVNAQKQDPKLKVHYVDLGNFPPTHKGEQGKFANSNLEKAVNNYLIINKITNKEFPIFKNGANIKANSGLMIQFKTNNQAVYFNNHDYRFFDSNTNLQTLLKMSN